jgi:hypothetical protein
MGGRRETPPASASVSSRSDPELLQAVQQQVQRELELELIVATLTDDGGVFVVTVI